MAITTQLAQFIHAASPGLACATLRARATRHVLDTLAVTMAGNREPGVQALQQAIAPSGDKDSIHFPWTSNRYRENEACLLSGMAAHILDYDDVCMLAICHASAPVLSALSALAQQTHATGSDFIDAYIIGTEIMIRCGQAMGFRHYDLGFHATATLGPLGAAAACSRLLGLSHAQTGHALSIAASLSSGVRKNFGSMVKSLHVGQAASAGLRATRLAAAGVQGADEAIEESGWLRAFSGGQTDTWPADLTLGQPFAMQQPGFEQKRYPCCYMMHKIIQATLTLKARYELSLQGLQQAHVAMCGGGTTPLIHPRPCSGLNAKFSGPYAVAGALLDGRMDLKSFVDAAVLRPAIQAAMANVIMEENDIAPTHAGDLGTAPVTVTLTYGDARIYTHTISDSPGSPEDPLTDADLHEKWRDCLTYGLPDLPADVVEDLFKSGLQLDALERVGTWLQRFSHANKTLPTIN